MGLEQILRKNYSGKKVFITGHTGFKGTWLIAILKILNASVKGYSLKPEKKSLYRSINGDRLCHSIIGDIRNTNKLVSEITAFKPDYIFHLAAQSLVRASYDKPIYTYDVNALGTANLLYASLKLDRKSAIIIVTTDKVYENSNKNVSFTESDRLGGYDPYSASKVCAEIITDSFQKSFPKRNIGIASARAGNVIGGGDWSNDRIIPDIITALHNNRPVILRNPDSIRPWQHVLDVLQGYLLLAGKLHSYPQKFKGAYNFGPSKEKSISVEYLTRRAISHWGEGNFKYSKEVNAVHEFSTLKLDSSKAMKKLNWSPKWDAKKSIWKTIEWYKMVLLNKQHPLDALLLQIRNYLQ